jgi:16S rRNA (adenine1518-N6/adenine1519-N6)-dimethyltransferase
LGALTYHLAVSAGKVLAVELDKDLTAVLAVELSELIQAGKLEIIQSDVLKLDLPALLAPYRHMNLKVAANLPYYITTPVILRLLECGLLFESITVMVQREVARRLTASPGTKDYGSLTLAVAYHAEAEITANVPANAFVPRPEVDSAVVCLRTRAQPLVQTDKSLLFTVIKAAFEQRRKTLVNALFSAGLGESKERLAAILTQNGLRADIRGEALDISQFARVAESIKGAVPCPPLL